MNNRILFRIHGVLGLITGVLLLVICLSGSILVFSEELDEAWHPALLTVEPQPVGTQALSLDGLYRQAQADFPQFSYIRFRRLPASPTQTVEVSLENGESWWLAYYDPHTGQLLGQRNARAHFLGWLLGLHYSLLAGKTGELLVGVLSIALLLLVVTGTIVYHKHFWKVLTFRNAFRFSNWRIASSSMHRLIGVWSLVFNLIMAITGFWMLRYVFLPDTYAAEKKLIPANLPFSVSLDSLQVASRQLLPDFRVRSIYLPKKAGDKITLYGQVEGQNPLFNDFSNSIEFDPSTGEPSSIVSISTQSSLDQWDAMVYPLHAGRFGGLLFKSLYSLLGLTPAALSITGFLLWWRRKSKSRPIRKHLREAQPSLQ
jgi:uncharacterized iron-regulated membrane protein